MSLLSARTYVFVAGITIACNGSGKSEITIKDTSPDADTDQPEDIDASMVDEDGDGWIAQEDCNDLDPNVNPQATEICNDIDDDCDGDIDEDIGDLWYVDIDGDGVGSVFLTQSCTPIDGAVLLSGDCNDEDPDIFPGNYDRIDGVDSNCDGAKDWLVTIYVSVDDAGEVCVNNSLLGQTGEWPTGEVYEVWLMSGVNTVGIYGWDLGQTITAGISHIEISDGSVWVTDETWTYSPDPGNTAGKEGWCTPAFDDSTWEAAQVIGPIGVSPWENAPSVFPATSPAQWIWDHFPVNLNSQYLRKDITLP